MAAVRYAGLANLLIVVALLSACNDDVAVDPVTAGAASPSTSSSGASSSSSSGSSTSSSSSGASTGIDVLTYHYDTSRTGQNLAETVLTPANVTASTFGLLRTLPTDDPVDAAPLIATNVTIGGSAHTVVYVATENDTVYAFDANSGALLLQVSLLASGETPSGTHNCNQVEPAIGITATPVIDRQQGANGTLYVVAMSLDGSGAYHQRLHALDLTTLTDRIPAVSIAATAAGTGSNSVNGVLTFDPANTKSAARCWPPTDRSTPYGHRIATTRPTTAGSWPIANPRWHRPPPELHRQRHPGSHLERRGLAADSSGTVYGMAGNGTLDTTLTTAGFPIGGDYGNQFSNLQLPPPR